MNCVEDERIKFYLKYEKQIREWVELGQQARVYANDFLVTLQDNVQSLAEELGSDLSTLCNVDGNDYPLILLHRPTWLSADHDRGLQVGIGLSWDRRGVTLGANQRPWVGTRVLHGKQLRKDLADALSPIRKSYRLGTMEWWPAWRYVDPAPDGYWDDLNRYRTSLIESVRQAWQQMSKTVDDVVDRGAQSDPEVTSTTRVS